MRSTRLIVFYLGLCIYGTSSLPSENGQHVAGTGSLRNQTVVGGIDDARPSVVEQCPKGPLNHDPFAADVLRANPSLSSPMECARTCRNGEPPKTCYYHFVIENYSALSRACETCTSNYTNQICNNCQCVSLDGVERPILTVNRMIPGPSIEVCQGDTVVVDVTNHVIGEEVTIHWHGVRQRGTQYYDGVPFVTQCPISEGNTFRYQWHAVDAGTHLWHAHTGLQKMDGIFGSLVVRQSEDQDPNGDVYDYDLSRHVIVISDWFHELSTSRFPGRLRYKAGQDPDSVLINGVGKHENPATGEKTDIPYAVFDVEQNRSYRFRLVNAFCTACASYISVDGHRLTIVATDGRPVKPVVVDSIVSSSGERYDFVINTNKSVDSYWIQVRVSGACVSTGVHQLGILRYNGAPNYPKTVAPTFENYLPGGVVLNPLDGLCEEPRKEAVCICHLQSAVPVDEDILQEPAVKLYLPFGFYRYPTDKLFQPNTYNRFMVSGGGQHMSSEMSGISLQLPSVPPLSQINDLSPDEVCSPVSKPRNCGAHCSCTNVLNLPYKGVVELILINDDNVPQLLHPFHLHGYYFHVMSMTNTPFANMTHVTKARLTKYMMDLDKMGALHRTFDAPSSKDTLAIPGSGYAIIRFRADNPGYWLLHCHFAYHLATGMGLVFRVGDPSDLPPVPKNFPTCGNYLPPIETQF